MGWIKNAAATLSGSRPILIAGPTASGKSALAMHLAEQLDGQGNAAADGIVMGQSWISQALAKDTM